MARSGSTLICKCLGAMKGINLLSEIHPLVCRQQFNPLKQAHDWYDLLTPEDFSRLHNDSISFSNAFALLDTRSQERGETLVIRDWGHIDYIGHPFLKKPRLQPEIYLALHMDFDLIRTSFVRHPLDQWISLSRLAIMEQSIISGALNLTSFLDGYLAFAREAAQTGFIRYEDFTREPEAIMSQICTRLELDYDPTFIDRWHTNTKITGDTKGTRGGNKIQPLKRHEIDERMLATFERESAYHESLKLLGYEE